MADDDIAQWSASVEAAEFQPLTADLPKEAPAGLIIEEDGEPRRKWLRIEVVGGNTGGRWAYWLGPKVPHPEYKAIADHIFNGAAAHFIGMLGVPYVHIPGSLTLAWVLVSPRMTGPRTVPLIDEKPRERYERSREIFDVETQTTTKL
jgi:hypothetical protein